MYTLVQPPRSDQESLDSSLGVRRQVLDEFMQAVRTGSRAQVFILVRELPELVNTADEQGLLPVHLAAKTGDARLLQMLVEHKADVHAVTANEERETPLHVAASYGKIASLRLLITLGADVNAQDANGFTPLICAVKTDQPDVVVFLHQVMASCSTFDWM